MEKKFHEKLREFATSDNAINIAAALGCDNADMRSILAAIAEEIERSYTPKRTCYEAIREMTFEELGKFIFRVYNKGWSDGVKREDDEAVFCCTMLDYPDTFLDEDWE